MNTRMPCPLTEEQCSQLDSIIDTIPKVQEIVSDCESCQIQIPGAAQSLANSLAVAKGIKQIIAKHFVQETQPQPLAE